MRLPGKRLIPLTARKNTKAFLKQYKAALDGRDVVMPASRARRTDGFVYFLDDGDFIKIGWAVDPETRWRDLQTGSARHHQLLGSTPGTLLDERNLHRKFAHLKHRGEWFKKEPELLSFIGIDATNSWSDA